MIEETTESARKVEQAKEQKRADSSAQPTIHVKVYSPYKVYYDEESYSISGENATGPFDVLPQHHNFITLLEPCILRIRAIQGQADERQIRISGGLMHVKSDRVTVFLDV